MVTTYIKSREHRQLLKQQFLHLIAVLCQKILQAKETYYVLPLETLMKCYRIIL